MSDYQMWKIAFQAVCMSFGIFFSFVNIGKCFRGDEISAVNIAIMSGAITGFIFSTWMVP